MIAHSELGRKLGVWTQMAFVVVESEVIVGDVALPVGRSYRDGLDNIVGR